MSYLTLNEYRKMVETIIETKNKTGSMPDYANIKGRQIPKRNYSLMIEDVNKFFLQQGRNPETVEIRY